MFNIKKKIVKNFVLKFLNEVLLFKINYLHCFNCIFIYLYFFIFIYYYYLHHENDFYIEGINIIPFIIIIIIILIISRIVIITLYLLNKYKLNYYNIIILLFL